MFEQRLTYGQLLKPDKIFIISALHHLLDLDKEIEPYDVTLSSVPKDKRKAGLKILNSKEKKEWGKAVLEQLIKVADLKKDEFIILAGQSYIKPVASGLSKIEKPLKGIVQGKRSGKLKELISELND